MKFIITLFVLFLSVFGLNAQEGAKLFSVYELVFFGENYRVEDNPVRDITLITHWRHKSKGLSYKIYGFYDADGEGGTEGNTFKVRFCPTLTGNWILDKVVSNDKKLHGQHEGRQICCEPSGHPGFWKVDQNSAGKRWYKRSDGSHPYIVGNTLYSFVSGYEGEEKNKNTITEDVTGSAPFFNKIRFAITGDIYPHPVEQPFLDLNGNPTNEGDYSHRPNPSWFRHRMDRAVGAMYDNDIVADIILNGPDSYDARSALLATHDGGDPTPFLRYIAARYGSYPNVWICLSNEYDIRSPRYTPEEIKRAGHIMKEFLPYNNPLSVHGDQGNWHPGLNSIYDWNDHIIFQNKIKYLGMSADKMELNYWIGMAKPVINDELAYEGEGDGWTEEDVIEAFLGAFLGGGYASTGYKSASKKGHYFSGDFSPKEHTSADNLTWFRKVIEENMDFWALEPWTILFSRPHGIEFNIFKGTDYDCRLMLNQGLEYVLGSNKAIQNIEARLPAGSWRIVMHDIVRKESMVLAENVSEKFIFNTPDSRASIIHFKKTR